MKRATLCIVFFLLLGAIINVAVAWGCAAWLTIDPTQSKLVQIAVGGEAIDHDWYVWQVWQLNRPGARRLLSNQCLAPSFFYNPEGRSKLTATAISKRFNSWNIAPHELRPNYRRGTTIVDGRGWPLQTLFWIARSDEDAGPALPGAGSVLVGYDQGLPASIFADFEPRYALRLQRTPTSVEDWYLGNPALPLHVIWRGLAINTIFYAVILWALCYAPVKLRSFVRDKRGMCPSCGYDLRHADHLVCPECGATP